LWVIGVLLVGWSAVALAQSPATAAAHAGAADSQEHGTLVIWWVTRATADERKQVALEKMVGAGLPRLPLDQRAPSELGQNAASFGQNAGSYGQTASSLGTNAGDTGQTAGAYGKPSSDIGTNAGDAGQPAGGYGQSAGSFGQAASTFGVAASDSDKATPARGATPFKLTPAQQAFAARIQAAFPKLEVHVSPVLDVQLSDKLAAARATASAPDVLIADRSLPVEWSRLAQTAGVAPLGTPRPIAQEFSDQPKPPAQTTDAAILLRAPHPAAARAFVVWLREGGRFGPVQLTAETRPPAEVAIHAAMGVLNGALPGDADPDLANFSPVVARLMAIAPLAVQDTSAVTPAQVEVLGIAANARFAVVELRATLASATSFGAAYPLVVLRRQAGGRWKVLQFTVNLAPEAMEHAYNELAPFAHGAVDGEVGAVSAMLPLSGEMRAGTPELGWQNGNGGRLLVVEWQQGYGEDTSRQWSDSNLYFVADAGTRMQTRVTAQFAQQSGVYRWRVWTLGAGGALRLSGWSEFHVLR
jgi:hypothetical protein